MPLSLEMDSLFVHCSTFQNELEPVDVTGLSGPGVLQRDFDPDIRTVDGYPWGRLVRPRAVSLDAAKRNEVPPLFVILVIVAELDGAVLVLVIEPFDADIELEQQLRSS